MSGAQPTPAADFGKLIGPVARALLGEPNGAMSKRHELRFGRRGSFTIDLRKGVWRDHESGTGGGTLALIERECGRDKAGALAWLQENGFLPAASRPDKPHIVATYDYRDEAGDLLFEVARFAPKDFRQRRPDGKGGWTWKLDDVRRVLYRLPQVIEAVTAGRTIYIVEGEKSADRLAALGLDATCSPGGAGKWKPDHAEALRGADVVISPDADTPGEAHARSVAASLHGIARRVRVLRLPGLPAKGDAVDWLDAGGTAGELTRLADATLDFVREPPADGEALTADRDEQRGEQARGAQRKAVIEAVLNAGATFWRDPDDYGFASVPLDPRDPGSALAHYPIRSRAFELACRRIYGVANPSGGGDWHQLPGSFSEKVWGEARPSFEVLALQGSIHEPDVRLVTHGDATWLDLGRDDRQTVRITAAGWTIQRRCEAPLIRSDGIRALPLPMPARGPTALADLRRLLNLGHDAEGERALKLIVGWLVMALNPRGPYPVLAIDGEQGSGKSTACRMLRRLIDPNAADLRAPPRDEEALLLAARNGRMLTIDNMSRTPADLSDALCRIATGGGFSQRRKYSDTEETIINVSRPVLLNGIPSVARRADLADRSLIVTLPVIPDTARREESAIAPDFERSAPGILGLLLDGAATALRRLPTLKLPRLPRMADFARTACAAAPAFGWSEADMLDAIEANRGEGVASTIEADAVASAVLRFAEERRAWNGTASDLLMQLGLVTPEDVKRERSWPKGAGALAAMLARVAPALRRVGVEIEKSRGATGRTIFIRLSTPPRPLTIEVPAAEGGAAERAPAPLEPPEPATSSIRPRLPAPHHAKVPMPPAPAGKSATPDTAGKPGWSARA